MSSNRTVVISCAIVVVAAVLITAWFRTRHAEDPAIGDTTEPETGTASNDSSLPEMPPASVVQERQAGAESGTGDCLSPLQLESHPIIQRDSRRYEPVSVMGPAIEAFRHLSADDIGEIMQTSDRQERIVESVARQFEQDRVSAGLPPVVVPESTAPSLDELASMVCESYLQQYREE